MSKSLYYSKYLEGIAVLLLLGIMLLQVWASIERINLTNDEGTHLASGYSYWKTRDFRLNREHPPLVKLIGSLPLLFKDLSIRQSWPYFVSAPQWDSATTHQWHFANSLLQENAAQLEDNLSTARRAESLFVLLLACSIYLFSRQLFGVAGGLISLLAAAFNPDMLAHACLITTDMAMATFYFATPVCLWWYLQRPSLAKLAATGLLLGFGLASKYSNLLLLPVLAVLVAAAWFCKPPCHRFPLVWFNPFGAGPSRKRAAFLFTASLAAVTAAALALWACYLFVEPFSEYWRGYQQLYKNYNLNFQPFLLGEYASGRFWHYFLVTIALKTPLPVFGLSVLALAAYVVHWRKHLPSLTKWVLCLPPLLLLLVVSFKAANIGHRYVLGIYPYIFVLLGMNGYWLRDLNIPALERCSAPALLTGAAMAATVYSGIAAYPFYLAYHNAVVASDMAFIDYLDDSNNDWGQGWKELARIQKEEHLPPLFVYQYFSLGGDVGGVRGNWLLKSLSREVPAPGIHALSATLYRRNKDWFFQHQLFNPLLHQYKPMRIIAGSIVLIEVPYPDIAEQKHALLTETAFHPSGQLQNLQQYYLNAKGDKVLSGINQIWNEKNNLKQAAYYIDGRLSGPYSLWSDSGRLLESGYMWNGKIHGKVYRWNDSGEFMGVMHYLEGNLMANP